MDYLSQSTPATKTAFANAPRYIKARQASQPANVTELKPSRELHLYHNLFPRSDFLDMENMEKLSS